ncbi:hypothetical protein [Streptomyces dysideae]|uniref:Uncharacterized protein n=1 Tax=Streptomyces dysideae TaxID=909626 RepID=A0A101V3L0_9ACTN|nr:hypothetical protein [Streptomyces dysideae]KUO21894.1 hypothetical protein AQJ91_07115 [Streptomyces dysideae]
MEQRIGSSSQPLEGAGSDPAFIPGLTSPVSGETEDAKDVDPDDVVEVDEAAPVEAEAPEEPSVEEVEEEEAEEEAEEDEAPDGPVFEASDRRAKIVADHKGVRLALDDQACEFRWDEIGAVETESPRFGKRFTITVHTPDRRWYPIEIEATARARFAEWETQLDAVLDAYFEDGEAESEDADPEAEVTKDADSEAEVAKDADTKAKVTEADAD